MPDRRKVQADVVFGAMLFVLAVALIAGAWNMDRLEIRQIHPLSAPGLTPGLLGLALAVASLMLVIKAARSLALPRPIAAGGDAIRCGRWIESPNPGAMRRVVISAALCLVYALGLIGRMPFWLATSLFVTTFILVFEWERSSTPAGRYRRLAWAVFLGLATGLAVSTVFRDVFYVRLP